jgi:Primase C terminal 2 (PriCT-2)/Bifunctional DNA primase/polymerase, N-terminal
MSNVTTFDSLSVTSSALQSMTRRKAALSWLRHGYLPMPVVEGTKATRVPHLQWLKNLSEQSADCHWGTFSNDDIALHCSKGLVVLDADSEESLLAIQTLEAKHNIFSNMTVKTAKGVHHYYRQNPGLRIQQKGYSTEKDPERVDIRCGNSYIIVAPSTGKSLATDAVVPFDQLVVLSQDFVDDLMIHNGVRTAPAVETASPAQTEMDDADECGNYISQKTKLIRLRALLDHLDPDASYSEWIDSLMAIHNETGGSDEGLNLADQWSRPGSLYKGFEEVARKWNSFKTGVSRPLTLASMAFKVQEKGLDALEICAQAEEQSEPFEPCGMQIVRNDTSAGPVCNPLLKFSLLDKVEEIINNSVEAKPMLGPIAMSGQVTAIWAAPNTGKTLIVLNLLKKSIGSGAVDPNKVFYANLDDGANGILVKSGMAQELRFHQIAFGFQGLSLETLKKSIKDAVANKTVKGSLLIIDTVKKVADVMNKTDSSELGALARQYSAVGGTVVLISHTNKNKDADGKPVYSGTSDILQDVDCGWVLSAEKQDGTTVVTFDNIKNRGFVPGVVRFAYEDSAKVDYLKLVDSVKQLSVDETAEDFDLVAQGSPDAKVVAEIKAQIAAGQNKKTALISAVSKATQVSQNKVSAVLDKYTNDDPVTGEWRAERRLDLKNAVIYSLHEQETDELELV